MMLLIRIGTLDYIAPEILDCPEKQHPGENKNFTPGDRWYDNKVDVWSCGIMAYDLLTGKAPFTGVRTGDVAVPVRIKTSSNRTRTMCAIIRAVCRTIEVPPRGQHAIFTPN